MFLAKRIAWMFLVVLGVSCLAIAQETADTASSADNVPSAERIDELIKQLDADRYSQREEAMEALIAIGKPAIAALGKAATAGSLEVTSRSIDALKKLYESSDEATKTAAEEALKKLAESKHPAAALRAKNILKPKDNPAARMGVPGRVIIGNAQIQVAGAGKRVSVSTVNGVKTIEIQENDKKTKIVDDPNKGIQVEITTKKDGKETTKKIEAKNADELKKKNKEVYDLYQQYGKQMGGAQFRFQFGNIGGRAIPMPVRPAQPAQQLQRVRVDSATRLLKMWTQHIARLTDKQDFKDVPKDSLDALQKQLDDAKQEIAKLEKRIQAGAEAAAKKAEEEKKNQTEEKQEQDEEPEDSADPTE